MTLSRDQPWKVYVVFFYFSMFLYPKQQADSPETYSIDGQYELFSEVTAAIKDGVKELALSGECFTVLSHAVWQLRFG